MKYVAIEQITRLESTFYKDEAECGRAAEQMTKMCGGDWKVEPVPDSMPVAKDRFVGTYGLGNVMAMINGDKKD